VVDARTIDACERRLRTPGLPPERYDRALWALAGVIYGRPDLAGEGLVSFHTSRFALQRLEVLAQRGGVLGAE
jgi:hypothetical protein